MSEINLLISSVGRKVALVKSFVLAAKDYPIKILVTDISEQSPALYFADDYFLSLERSSSHFVDDFLRKLQKYKVKFLLSTSDQEMLFFAGLRKQLLVAGVMLIASSENTLQTCISKTKFAKFCSAKNFLQPNIYKNLDEAEFPLVVKKEFSTAGSGVLVIQGMPEAKRFLTDCSEPFLLQEFIETQEFSVDAFFDRNGNLVAALPRSRDKVALGESVVTTSKDIPELVEVVKNLGKQLNFWGHITVQAFFDGQNCKLVEINPRFGGASSLSFSCGVNSPLWIVQEMVGIKLSKQELKFNQQLMRYSADLIREV